MKTKHITYQTQGTCSQLIDVTADENKMRKSLFKAINVTCVVIALLSSVVSEAKIVHPDSAAVIASRLLQVNRSHLRRVQPSLLHPLHQKGIYSTYSMPDAYHIFTPESGGGFVVVAGDDIAKPILGFSPTGRVSEVMPPAMQEWLQEMADQINHARMSGLQPSTEIINQWKSPGIGTIVKELETAPWGQRQPFNEDCPYDDDDQCLTGCVATSFAILMKYYQWPYGIRKDIPAYRTQTTNIYVDEREFVDRYYWDEMPMDYRDGYSNREGREVARLMADVGAAFRLDYGKDETRGYMGLIEAFTFFDFYPSPVEAKENYTLTDWYNKLKVQIRLLQPVWYRGADDDGNNGHVFIIDGYTNKDYFSVNWGWDGAFNGYYALDAMMPEDISYNSGQCACFGVVPTNRSPQSISAGGNVYTDLDYAIMKEAPMNGTPTVITLNSDDIYIDDVYIDEGQVVILRPKAGKTPNVRVTSFILNKGTLRIEGDINFINCYKIKHLIRNDGTLTIDGGRYSHNELPYDMEDDRHCVWSADNTSTTINDGIFHSNGATLLFYGDAVIKEGTFTCDGNREVLLNFNESGTVTIKGGTFTNNGTVPVSETDYRRAVWTDKDTKTVISGGSFCAPMQVLCFNGDATIDNAKLDNGFGGWGVTVFSGATVIINSCYLYAQHILSYEYGSTLKCRGGFYSMPVFDDCLDTGFLCVNNTDAATCGRYPYAVKKEGSTKLNDIRVDDDSEVWYSIDGRKLATKPTTKGIYIKNGKKLIIK